MFDIKLDKRFFWLDWVRFLAAFQVVVCHCRAQNWVEWGRLAPGEQDTAGMIFFALTRPGLELVVVFFVLSGFLVGGKALERVLAGNFRPLDFLCDRVTRIYVPLIPAMIFSAVVTGGSEGNCQPLSFFINVLGLQGIAGGTYAGNSPLWSLAYEIWFYVMVGCGAALLSSAKQGHFARSDSGRRCTQLACLIGLAISFWMLAQFQAVLTFCWCLGMLGYTRLLQAQVHERQDGEAGRWRWLALGLSLLGAGVLLAQVASGTVSLKAFFLTSSERLQSGGLLLLSLGLVVLLPELVTTQPGRMAWLEKRGTFLASFSYTLYLTHYPVLAMWQHRLPVKYDEMNWQSIGMFTLKIVTSLILAYLMYLAFEARTASARRFLKGRLSAAKAD